MTYMYSTRSGHSAFCFQRVYYKYETNKNIIYFFCLFFFNNLSKDAFHDPSSKDCKQSNSMQTRALLNLDKKYCKIFLRAKQLPVKGLIDNRCHALEAVPERRAIHKLNAYFFLQKIKSECKCYSLNKSLLKGLLNGDLLLTIVMRIMRTTGKLYTAVYMDWPFSRFY